MNKVIAAVGLTVLSAASVQAQDLAAPPVKDWSVAISLRGFYDDNYLTRPASYPGNGYVSGGAYTAHPLASWGTEAIPSAAWNHAAEGATEYVSYVYDMRRDQNFTGSPTTDQSHQLNLGGTREFSPQYKLNLNESFVVAQEPTVIDPSVVTSPLRVEGNNIRNTGMANFTDSITKDLDLQLGYVNTVYAYPQLADSVIGYPFGAGITPPANSPTTLAQTGAYPPEPSRSALLNRMEQLATVDLKWKFTPTTTGLFGYQFGDTSYTSGEYINYPYGGGSPYLPPADATAAQTFKGDHSKVRDSYSHYVFVGGDEAFSDTLNASLRVGGEYLDYYNNVDALGNSAPTSRVSPYVDASLTDQYQPGCTVQLGVKHLHNSTDVVGTGGDVNGETVPVLDEESTAIYFSDNHKLTEKLTASVMGQAQLSTFVGGGPEFDGKMDQFFLLQVNFAYHFSPWLSAETGYNFNRLKSDLPERGYTRDFMYLGVRATY